MIRMPDPLPKLHRAGGETKCFPHRAGGETKAQRGEVLCTLSPALLSVLAPACWVLVAGVGGGVTWADRATRCGLCKDPDGNWE